MTHRALRAAWPLAAHAQRRRCQVVALVEEFRDWGRILYREFRVFWNWEPPKPVDRHLAAQFDPHSCRG